MTEDTTSRRRSALVLTIIVGLPLLFTVVGLFVAGPLASNGPVAIPTDCGEAFVDESPETQSTTRRFSEISRVRLFDCRDRFVVAVTGAGDAGEAFAAGDAGDRTVVSVTLIDEFGDLHERRVVEQAGGSFTATFDRGEGVAGDVRLEAVSFDGPTVVIEFPRGRGDQRVARIEVDVTERSAGATVHDDLAVDF